MAITSSIIPLGGTGELLCSQADGSLLFHRLSSQYAGSGRLLCSAEEATRIVGTATLRLETDYFRYDLDVDSLPGYSSSASTVQAAANALCPPSSPLYTYSSSGCARTRYSVSQTKTDFRQWLHLVFFTYRLSSGWYNTLNNNGVPQPYRISVATVSSTLRLYIPTLGNLPYSGIKVAQSFTNPYIDYTAGSQTVTDIWGPAASAITGFPPTSDLLFEYPANNLVSTQTQTGNFDFTQTQAGERDLVVYDSSAAIVNDTRNLCVQTWFTFVPVGDGVTGTRSREFYVYLDSLQAELALYVPGNVQGKESVYASAYNLS